VLQILDDTVNLGPYSALAYTGSIPTDFVHVYTKKSTEVRRTEKNTRCWQAVLLETEKHLMLLDPCSRKRECYDVEMGEKLENP